VTGVRQGRVDPASPMTSYRALIYDPPINLGAPECFADPRWLIDTLEADDDTPVVIFESSTPEFFLAHFDVFNRAHMDTRRVRRACPCGRTLRRGSCTPRPSASPRCVGGPAASVVSSRWFVTCRSSAAGRAHAGATRSGPGAVFRGAGTERLPRLAGRARAQDTLGGEDFGADTHLNGDVQRRLGDVVGELGFDEVETA